MSSVQHNNPKLLWGITAGLVAIIAIFALYQWLFAAQESATPCAPSGVDSTDREALPEAEKQLRPPWLTTPLNWSKKRFLKAPVP